MAAFDIIALDTATPQLRVPGASDTYNLPRITSIAAGTLTTAASPLSITATYNNAGVTFPGVVSNVTNTASNAASLLHQWQVGGSLMYAMTTGRAFQIFNAYTDASNYERGFIRWSGNVLQIGTDAAGTGVARDVAFIIGNGTLSISTGSVAIDSARQFRIGNQAYISSSAVGLLRVSTDNITAGACAIEYNQFASGAGPAAPAAGRGRLYCEDNGTGKMRLMVRFPSGAAQQVAIEP